MSSSLINIKVTEKKESEVQLIIEIINQDEYYFYEKKNFALQIIWEPVQVLDLPNSALAKDISLEKITDSEWVLANADKYINEVKILSTKNYPEKDEIAVMNRLEFDQFRKRNGIPQAIFSIEVSSPKWIDHVKLGMEWESASYDMEE